jgi:CBS domain-containing protein
MKISKCMTRDVQIADPNDPIGDAARMMADLDVGAIPVGANDRLVGMVTDRDIAIRAVAEGKSSDCMVHEVMTPGIRYCFDDEDVEQVLETMGESQIRRLPVLNRKKRMVGIVSLGDLALEVPHQPVGYAIHLVSQPGGERLRARL